MEEKNKKLKSSKKEEQEQSNAGQNGSYNTKIVVAKQLVLEGKAKKKSMSLLFLCQIPP